MYINVHPRQYSRVNEIKQNKDKLFTSITCTAIRHILDSVSSIYQVGRDPGKISWQILGICQQMAGNHRSALHSYGKSLLHASDSDPKIDSATMLRIQYLHLS